MSRTANTIKVTVVIIRLPHLASIVFEEDADTSNPVCLDKQTYSSFLSKYCPPNVLVDGRPVSTVVSKQDHSRQISFADEGLLTKENLYLRNQVKTLEASLAADRKKWAAILSGKDELRSEEAREKKELLSKLDASIAKQKTAVRELKQMEDLAYRSAEEIEKLKEDKLDADERIDRLILNNKDLTETLHHNQTRMKELEDSHSRLQEQNSTLLASVIEYEASIARLQSRTIEAASQNIEQYQVVLQRVKSLEQDRESLAKELASAHSLHQILQNKILELESKPKPLTDAQLESLFEAKMKPIIAEKVKQVEEDWSSRVHQLQEKARLEAATVDQEYIRVLTELKQREANNLANVESKDEVVKEIEKELGFYKAEVVTRDNLIAEMTSVLKKAKLDLRKAKDEKEKELELQQLGFNDEIKKREAKLRETEEEVKSLQRVISERHEKIIHLEDKVHVLELRVSELDKKTRSDKEVIADLRQLVSELRLREEALTLELKDEATKVTALEDKLEEKTIDAIVKGDHLREKDKQINTMEMTIKRLEEEKKRVEHQLASKSETVQDRYRRLSALYDALETKCGGLEESNRELSNKNVSLENQLARYSDMFKAKNREMEEVMGQLEQKEKVRLANETMKKDEIEAWKNRVEQRESELERREAELARAVVEIERQYKDVVEDNMVKEKEIKTLLQEIDLQKKLAQKNIASLAKMFS